MIKRTSKGVALVWTMLTCAVLLLMGTIIANVVIREIHMVTNFTLSSQAINAAEAGINYGKWCLDYQDSTNPCNVDTFGSTCSSLPGEDHCSQKTVNVGSVPIVNAIQIKKEGNDYRINSWGISGRVTRKLSYLYSGEKNISTLDDTPVTGAFNASKIASLNYPSSFSFSFDFWTQPADVDPIGNPSGTTATNGNVLLANFYGSAGPATQNIKIYYNSNLNRTSSCLTPENSGSGPTLIVSSDSVSGLRCLPLTDYALNGAYAGTVFVRYTKNINATVTYKQRVNMIQESCSVSKQLDLTNLPTTRFTQLAVNGAASTFDGISGYFFRITSGVTTGSIYLDNFKPYQ